jgi:cytidylate kinase
MALVSGTLLAIQQRITAKLLETGATSRETAVTAQEAHLDVQEQNWLHYVAGGLFARVKKTEDKRYYVLTYKKA